MPLQLNIAVWALAEGNFVRVYSLLCFLKKGGIKPSFFVFISIPKVVFMRPYLNIAKESFLPNMVACAK